MKRILSKNSNLQIDTEYLKMPRRPVRGPYNLRDSNEKFNVRRSTFDDWYRCYSGELSIFYPKKNKTRN